MERRYLSIKECSEYIGFSWKTIYRWCSERRIPHHKTGKSIRFDIKAIDTWMNNFNIKDENSDLFNAVDR